MLYVVVFVIFQGVEMLAEMVLGVFSDTRAIGVESGVINYGSDFGLFGGLVSSQVLLSVTPTADDVSQESV